MSTSPGPFLRRLASFLVRGPDARFMIGDLHEGYQRDLTRSGSRLRAQRRFIANAIGSAFVLWRGRLSIPPQIPGMSLLDLKLAVRMLGKHPGLTAVAVFALALGIPASLAPFHLIRTISATLPFEDGERIVGVRHRPTMDSEGNPATFHAFETWRANLKSFEHLSASYSDHHNIIAEDGSTRPFTGSWMSASTWRLLQVPPLLGRPLLAADEVAGAPDVVVIGYDVWRTFLAADPGVLGRTIKVGDIPHTIVGVMPEGFLFPRSDNLWLPLRAGPLQSAPGDGPQLLVYGKLKPGVTRERALAEMSSVHRGLADAYPEVYGKLAPEIVPFTHLTIGNVREQWMAIAVMQLVALVLLTVACGNVGTLILARTAARSGELAVRTALGASRGRIVSQLFAESLVLAVLSTGIGLAIAAYVANRVEQMQRDSGDALPFWFDLSLDYRTMVPAMALAVFSAVVAGVFPALKATGKGIQATMQQMGNRGTVRFGYATTALIVTEVALGVVCLFGGLGAYRFWKASVPAEMSIRPQEFLTVRLALPNHALSAQLQEPDTNAMHARSAAVQREVMQRLSEEPGVGGVAVANRMPGQNHPEQRIEVDGGFETDDRRGHPVYRNFVDVGFFTGLGQPILQGRNFAPDDVPAETGAPSRFVIVNTSFVQRVLRGRNAIGQRVRYAGTPGKDPGPWHEIIGVVGHLGMTNVEALIDDAGMYHPYRPNGIDHARMAVRPAMDPMAFVPRLREIVASIDPDVLVLDPRPMHTLGEEDQNAMAWTIFAILVVAGIAVVLSVAGLYALMAFTVAQRRHEIGVRAALGADSANIISLIAKRAAFQLTVGIAIGVVVTTVLMTKFAPPTALTPLHSWPLMLTGACASVILVGLIACAAPARRGLSIRPIEALKAT